MPFALCPNVSPTPHAARRRLTASQVVLGALLPVTLGACGDAVPPRPPPPPTLPTVAGTPPLVAAGTAPVAALQAVGLPASLTVTFAVPRGDVPRPTMGAVGFSEPMVALQSLDVPAEITGVQVAPALDLRWQWIGVDTLAFYPTVALPGASEYQVTVASGVRALSGRTLEQPFSYAFRTAPVALVRTEPQDAATQIARQPVVLLEFSQQVDAVSLRAALRVDVGALPFQGYRIEVPSAPQIAVGLAGAAGPANPLGAQERDARALVRRAAELAGRVVLVRVLERLPERTKVKLVLSAGIHSKEGPLPAPALATTTFETHGPFAVAKAGCDAPCDPGDWSPIRVEFTNPLERSPDAAPWGARTLDVALKVEPPVKDLRVSCWHDHCSLQGAFEPDRAYAVTVPADVRDMFGQVLGAPFAFPVKLGHRRPFVELRTEGSVLELGEAPHRLAVHLRNVGQVEAKTAVLGAQGLADRVSAWLGADSDAPAGLPLDRTLEVRGVHKPEVVERRALDLAAVLAGKPGIVGLDVSSPTLLSGAGKVEHQRGLYQITDLHVAAKVGAAESVVWVTSFRSGQPVAGAKVEWQAGGGLVTWSGTTNADGIALAPGGLGADLETRPATPADAVTPLLVVRHGDDAAFLRLDDATRNDWGVGWTGGVERDADGSTRRLRAHLHTDKEVFRLGETVHCKGIVRRLAGNGLELLPAGTAVDFDLSDPLGRPVATKRAQLSALGTFAVDAVIPERGGYGTYTLRAKLGDESFAVDVRAMVYRAPRFRVEGRILGSHFVRGDVVRGQLEAAWYTGGALHDAPAKLSAWGETAPFQPAGWPGYAFGPTVWDEANGTPLQHTDSGRTDAKGVWSFQVPTAAPSHESQRVALDLQTEDPNGNPVSTDANFWLHPAALHVGIGLASSLAPAGLPVMASVVVVDAEGAPQPAVTVEVELLHREWKSVRQKTIGGSWTWQTQRIDTRVGACSVTAARLAVPCALTPLQPGYHLVVAQARDSKRRLARTVAGFHALGPGHVAFSPDDAERGMLVADRAAYEVGDVAKVLVRTPVAGMVAIVTEEQQGILRTRRVVLDTTAETIEVPIEARHRPNVFVSVVAFAGRHTPEAPAAADLGAPMLRLGYVHLPVSAAAEKLKVALLPKGTTFAPRAEVEVSVELRDAAGLPRAGEVTLWAADEGVLALSGMATPDPHAALYAPIALGVRNHALIGDLVRERVEEAKGDEAGGGSDGAASVRSRFEDVPLWLPALPVGADGKATAKFRLPDNLGTFRLMATAVGGATAFGSGAAQVVVKKPLMLLPALPKAVELGDRFDAVWTARNPGTAKVSVTCTVDVTGGLRQDGDPAHHSVTLEPGEAREISVALVAVAAGDASVTLRAQGQTAGSAPTVAVDDAVQTQVRVDAPRALETVATHGFGRGAVNLAVAKAPGADPALGGLQVEVAASGVRGLGGGLEYLLTYPYGCTEQLASQLYALLQLERLGKEHGLLPDQARQAGPLADAAIVRILAQRHGGATGAFALWPGGDASVPATAWSLIVLQEASQHGHAVEAGVLRDGAAWLRAQLGSDQRPHAMSEVDFDAGRALVLAALAALGAPAAGYADDLLARRARLPADAQALLGLALAAGDPASGKAKVVTADLLAALVVEGDRAHLPAPPTERAGWLWPSDIRTNALLLDLVLRTEPTHPLAPRLARWLADARGAQHWPSTQDNAWALRALQAWYAVAEREVPNLDVRVLLGGAPVGAGRLQGRTAEPVVVEVLQGKLPAGTVPLRLEATGPGAFHHSVRYRYALADAGSLPARNAGFLVRRTVLDSRGTAGRTTFARGEHVLVAVSVLADARRWNVAVVDRPPAGFEPVDFALATASPALRTTMAALRDGRFGALGGSGGENGSDVNGNGEGGTDGSDASADHQELAGREVRFFIDDLGAGVHTYSYVARAAVRGTFAAAGARAEAMYRPEVFGSGGGVRATVQ